MAKYSNLSCDATEVVAVNVLQLTTNHCKCATKHARIFGVALE